MGRPPRAGLGHRDPGRDPKRHAGGPGIGLVLPADRFIGMARALGNFIGDRVAAIVVAA